MIQYHIGARIKQRRTELKMSQEQLALSAAITPTYLGQIERAERNPTVGLLEKLADALNVRVGYFFESEMQVGVAESRMLNAVSDLNEQQKLTVANVVDMIVSAMQAKSENPNE